MSHFNIDGLKQQLLEMHETMNEPDFWNDLERSTAISKKVRIAENKVEHWKKLGQRADDVEATMELAEEMEDEDLVSEAGAEIRNLLQETMIPAMLTCPCMPVPAEQGHRTGRRCFTACIRVTVNAMAIR